MNKKAVSFLLSLIIIFSLFLPLPVKASGRVLEGQLRAAIDSLSTPFTVQVYDPGFDVDKFAETFDFDGVMEWAYSGRGTSNSVTMTWEFKWEEVHAVLAAFRNPSLERRLDARQSAVLERCRAILNQYVTADMTDYEIEKMIHDYLCTTVRYDAETAETQDISDQTPFTAYGALMEGVAVCQGYTNAAAILLTMAGISNYIMESETHTWNLVQLDGDYYHMDTTWDGYESEQVGSIQYSYFNLTDQQITRYSEHTILDAPMFPAAQGTAYHYYQQYRRVADSLEDIKWFVTQACEKGDKSVTVWVSNHRTDPYDWNSALSFVQSLAPGGKPLAQYTAVTPGPDRDTLTIIFE